MNLITLNPPLYFIALFLRFILSLSHADRFEPLFCRRAMPTNRSLLLVPPVSHFSAVASYLLQSLLFRYLNLALD